MACATLVIPLVHIATDSTAASASPAPASRRGEPAAPSLTWTPCDPLLGPPPAGQSYPAGMVCTRITVPLDYSRPSGRTTTLAVSKIPASDPARRRGIALFNPGGPGVPGTTLPVGLVSSGGQSINAQFDLIGFDPRATGASETPQCLSVKADPVVVTGDISSKKAIAAEVATRSKQYAACIERDREFIAQLGARTTARDMDSIRAALGEKKMSFVGVSWGSVLGLAYNSLFPKRVDRMVIDSVLNAPMELARMVQEPARVGQGHYDALISRLAKNSQRYKLGTTTRDVDRKIKLALDNLAKRDLHSDDSHVTRRDLLDSLGTAQIEPDQSDQQIAATVAAAAAPAATPAAADTPSQPHVASMVEAAYVCNEARYPGSVTAAWSLIQKVRKSYPDGITITQPHYASLCLGWPKSLKITPPSEARASAPTLVVGHTNENVTPYVLAQSVTRSLHARLLTVRDARHGTLPDSTCAWNAIVEFLERGKTKVTSCASK